MSKVNWDDRRNLVLQTLRDSKYALSSAALVRRCNMPIGAVRRALRDLRDREEIWQTANWHSRFGYTWVYSPMERN